MLPTFTNSFYIINFLIKIPVTFLISYSFFSSLPIPLFYFIFLRILLRFYSINKRLTQHPVFLFFFIFFFSFFLSFSFNYYPSFRSKATTSLFIVFFGSISSPFSTLIFFFPNQKHLCPHLHIFNQNICVSQNDKVRQKENETTYLDPEAQTCPALVPVLMLSMLVPLW